MQQDYARSIHLGGPWRVLPWLAAGLLLLAIVVRAGSALDMTWDSVAYHLPFIAFRVGFLEQGELILGGQLPYFFEGFSPLFDYVRGYLWILTGSIVATNFLNIIALCAFSLYVHRYWKISAAWVVLGLLAIPILLASVSSSYTDVVSNLALAAVILCVAEVNIDRRLLGSSSFWLRLFIAAFVAGNSKLQIGAITVVALAFLAVPLAIHVVRDHPRATRILSYLGICSALLLVTNATLVRNVLLFANPVYPVAISVGPFNFAGPYDGAEGHFPPYLSDLPQAARWFLSVIEYRALELRSPSYTVDMGGVPSDAVSGRMGGFMGMLVFLSLLFLVRAALMRRDRTTVVLTMMMALSSVVAANMPSSHEARYYLFWMVLLVVSALVATARAGRGSDPFLYKAGIAGSLCVGLALTGGASLRPNGGDGEHIAALYRSFIADHADRNTVFCAASAPQLAFLASPAMHREIANSTPYVVEAGVCSDGSTPLPPL